MSIASYFTRGVRGAFHYASRKLILGIVNTIALSPSFRPVQDLRCLLLRLGGYSIGNNVQISEHFFILNTGRLFIEDNARIGTHARLYNFSPIFIGKNLLASHGLTLISASHEVETLANKSGPITIGQDVWIGINVTIVGPVKVGNNAVIGAGSVVLQDIPADAIVAGVPARIIRMKPSA
jgi:acetyltransferase-like isoleucine patch superfamily enzyme